MGQKYFVISNIHGELTKLKKVLQNWDRDSETLVILGDLIDRGEDSFGVIQLIMELQSKYDVVVLKGNHEEMILDALDGEDQRFHRHNGGENTLRSFRRQANGGELTEVHFNVYSYIQKFQQHIINWLVNLPMFYETKDYIFVHAGIDLELDNWKESTSETFLWDRDFFYENYINNTGKTIIFGHTPTLRLPGNKNFDIWYSKCGTKIGIDGGCAYKEGQLNYLQVEDGE